MPDQTSFVTTMPLGTQMVQDKLGTGICGGIKYT